MKFSLAARLFLVSTLALGGFGVARIAAGATGPHQCSAGATKHSRCIPVATSTGGQTTDGGTTTTSASGTTTTSSVSTTTTTAATTTTTTPTTTTTTTTTPGWTTPTCDVTLAAGTDLSAPLNNSANAGKVICLQDGTYSMQLSQHVAGIKVWALHQYQAKIYGDFVIWAPGSEWHGVYLNNGPNPTIGSPGPEVYADNFVFVDGIFTNGNTADGFYLGSGTYGIAHDVLIARNKIFNVGRPPGGTGADHPFYPAMASGNITDNWLWGNLGFGMMFWPHSFSLTYAYNVVDSNQEADIMFASTGTNDVVSHNIVANNGTGVNSYQQTGSGAEVDHTWFWNVATHYSGGGYTQGGGDGNGDPLFVDAANHNYNLKTGSPAAGYGPRVTLPDGTLKNAAPPAQ